MSLKSIYYERSSGSLWGVRVKNPHWSQSCLWEASAGSGSAVCSHGAVLAVVSMSPAPGDPCSSLVMGFFKPNWPKQREHWLSGEQRGACTLNIHLQQHNPLQMYTACFIFLTSCRMSSAAAEVIAAPWLSSDTGTQLCSFSWLGPS